MPLFGTLDLDRALADAPTIDGLNPEPWSLPGAETLQISYEVAEEPALAVTPPGLHPSIPPYATFSFCRVPDSPAGPFTLAMVRLIVRAGIRPRGLLIKAFVQGEPVDGADDGAGGRDVAERLRRGWGYQVSPATVSLTRRHDRIVGSVVIDGESALQVSLTNPEPIVGADLELFDNLHLVKQSDGQADGEPLIVQVDPSYEYHNADRGRPDIGSYQPDLLGTSGIDPVYPVVAVACVADMELTAPRFVIDPTVPAVQGTRRLSQS